ncbi:thiol reductant ABC exporter subunit CydD [Streptomyces sp. SID11385]|uniref:thiol reductant ABC exporter subunit CydD n=1 Tax=Streptomyces sp. SID11385 TaxID=2706031 RepID=UPI0013C5E408|nr:thiol reductant ABC exporter subunit CydD [Streptomyces sp. SID11385]
MKPVDPRLLRYARATRFFLVAVVGLGVLGALLVVAQAMLIAEVVVGAFQHGKDAGELLRPLLLLVAVAGGRGLVSWLTETAAHRASAAVKSELRQRVLKKAAALGPGWLEGRRTGSLVNLATRGVDALDDYFSRYLPQLGLAVVVPLAVLARIVTEDWVSAAIIVITIPLIPVFMILIGWATQKRMARQWRLLSRLSGHFLDVVEGLPTLKVFGRAKAQAESIRRITGEYRRATMRTLRIAFLSSFALELLSTLSVALVAVTIGMRLVHGDMDLYVALVVLVLAPEAYLPLRQVGTQYHAAAEGLAAAEEVFEVLETEERTAGEAEVPEGELRIEDLTVRYPGRTAPALDRVSLRVRPGETVALVGPSGAGKSTLLQAVLGFARPAAGRVTVGGTDLAEIDPARWHARIAWVPQRPALFAGTLAENVLLARPAATEAEVVRALRDAGAWEFVRELPDGVRTVLGEDGAGLSAGQRQRLALARAFLADRPVLLLDEPTAALDGATEAGIVEAVGRLAAGRTVLLVVHRPALLAVADRVVRIEAARDAVAAGAVRAAAGAAAAPLAAGPVAPSTEVAGPVAAEPRKIAGPGESGARTVLAPLARVRGLGSAHRRRLALALLLGALALASAVGLMATSGWLISRASQEPPVLYLMVAVTATRAFGIGRSVFRYAERLVSHEAVLRMLADTRVAVFRGLARLSPAGLRDRRRGDLLSRLVADVDAFQDYWLRWLLPAGAAFLVSAGAVGFTAWLLPEAGAVLAAGLLLAGVGVPWLTARRARSTERRLAPARGVLATRVTELLTGTGELTVAGAMPARLRAAGAADAELTGIAARASAFTALGDGLMAFITGLTVAGAAACGASAVVDGRLSGVALAVVVLTPLAAFEAVLGLPLAVRQRQRVRRSAERVYEVLDAPAPVREPERPAEAPASPFPLRLEGLVARHPGAARPALDGVDLTLDAGRRIAVVGASGAGKTTLAHVLLRFLDAESGTYRVGDTPATALHGDAVREVVGLCAQDAHVFDSSVRENLLLARKDATEAELRTALSRARLLDWVDTLPHGLGTLVGEHGARLSGGQRQRLALARALLADFPVLVLDEPAEHLDLETADALTRDLLAATEGRTTLLITHRLAGLAGAVDEVVVLDEGRVVQRGDMSALLSAPGPLRRMWRQEQATDALRGAAGETPAGSAPAEDDEVVVRDAVAAAR